MARNRDMKGQKKNMNASDDMFAELLGNANPIDEEKQESNNKELQKNNLESIPESTLSSVLDNSTEKFNDEDNQIEEIIEKIVSKESSTQSPSVVNKGGKLKIGSRSKGKKSKKPNFSALNENGLYDLQKKNKDTEVYLELVKKTFSIRPDVEEILKAALTNERGGVIKGLQATFINNAIIFELIRIGVLDEASLSEIEDY
ncbi:hypothetical protein [Enterococcus sp. DIV0086]|uniref:hypothetical protein n=1 Tax=Enterococcus sp. DIV0086 TaxID=2774655 RepID=UPI003D2B399B